MLWSATNGRSEAVPCLPRHPGPSRAPPRGSIVTDGGSPESQRNQLPPSSSSPSPPLQPQQTIGGTPTASPGLPGERQPTLMVAVSAHLCSRLHRLSQPQSYLLFLAWPRPSIRRHVMGSSCCPSTYRFHVLPLYPEFWIMFAYWCHAHHRAVCSRDVVLRI